MWRHMVTWLGISDRIAYYGCYETSYAIILQNIFGSKREKDRERAVYSHRIHKISTLYKTNFLAKTSR